MAKRKRGMTITQSQGILIAVIIIAGGVAAGSLYYAYDQGLIPGLEAILQPTEPVTPVEPGEVFGIVITDGVTGDVLDGSDFDYTLYGLLTGDFEDYGDFEIIETDDNVDGIREADLEVEDYPGGNAIKINGTVPESEFDDGCGDRTYYEMDFPLYAGRQNNLVVYRKPSSAGIVILNSSDISVIDISTVNITSETNFTVIAATNQSECEWNARYVENDNYENEVRDTPYLLVTLNDTLDKLSYLDMQGATKERVNDTAVKYKFYTLTPIGQTLYGLWDEDAPADIEIIDMDLYYGDSKLA